MRNLPKDIVDFAIEYFKCLQQGPILDYPHRGKNIPCIFKLAIPKIPELLKNQSNINYSEYPKSPKQEIKQEKKEEKKEEKKIFDKNLKLDNVNDNLPLSKEKVSQIIQTVSSDKSKNNLYTNCIDFGEKEEILNKLKENPEYQPDIEDYISSRFVPNKNINDLIALIQKTIMSYYTTKGTDKESEYDKLKEEVDNKINELKDKIPLIGLDFDSMDMKDAVNEFKKYEYYEKILKIYI